MLDIIKNPNMKDLSEVIGPRDAVITSLMLGFVEDEYYSTEFISEMLDISNEEALKVTKEALLHYKNSFVEVMDTITDNLDNKKLIKQ